MVAEKWILLGAGNTFFASRVTGRYFFEARTGFDQFTVVQVEEKPRSRVRVWTIKYRIVAPSTGGGIKREAYTKQQDQGGEPLIPILGRFTTH